MIVYDPCVSCSFPDVFLTFLDVYGLRWFSDLWPVPIIAQSLWCLSAILKLLKILTLYQIFLKEYWFWRLKLWKSCSRKIIIWAGWQHNWNFSHNYICLILAEWGTELRVQIQLFLGTYMCHKILDANHLFFYEEPHNVLFHS